MPIEIVKIHPKKTERGKDISPLLEGTEIRYFQASDLDQYGKDILIRYGGQPKDEKGLGILNEALEKRFPDIPSAEDYLRRKLAKK